MNVHHDADQAAARAESLIAERRRWERTLRTVAGGPSRVHHRLTDRCLDQIDGIDVDLGGSEVVISWGRKGRAA